VQPTGDEGKWTGKPFEPRRDGDRLYARGAADDKAGVVAHLAAVRALLAAGTDLGIGVTVFIEGEEEIGSPTFGLFLDQYGDRLAGDAIVVADSGNVDGVTPGQTVSLRGIVVLDVTVATLRTLVHSGGFGGVVPDAMMATAILIASMYHEDGSVAVAGLTRGEPLTDFVKDEAAFRSQSTVLDGVESIGRGTTTERNAYSPSITVTGIDAPSTARASNVLLPSVTFRIAARVAPGQTSADATEALERHLASHAPFGAHVRFDAVAGGEPFAANADGWAAKLMTDALATGWDAEPAHLAQGGSIPFVPLLSAAYPDAEILLTGVGDDRSRAHGIDESLSLSVLRKAITAETMFLATMNRRGTDAR
jgi:acetylornithine deacetylase/succinyl-diaminopimelate desuccinylase-like protein